MTGTMIFWEKEGELKQQTPLTDTALRIGRSQRCGVQLRGWGIAKEHAVIVHIDGQHYIRDLGGLGGVKVNGERIRDFGPLSPSDKIQIGAYLLQISEPSLENVRSARVSAPFRVIRERQAPAASTIRSAVESFQISDCSGLPPQGKFALHPEPFANQEIITVGSTDQDGRRQAQTRSDEVGDPTNRPDAGGLFSIESGKEALNAEQASLTSFQVPPALRKDEQCSDHVLQSNRHPLSCEDTQIDQGMTARVDAEGSSHLELSDEKTIHAQSAQFARMVSWLRAAAFAELDRQGTRVGDKNAARLEDDLKGICYSLLSTEQGRNQDLIQLPEAEKHLLIQATVDECLGLGPIQPLMKDPAISEIMVNGPDAIYTERDGRLYRAALRFSSEQSLRHVADRIAARSGRRLDLAVPTMDARLPDGSRVNIVLPPLAIRGTHITIRKFSRNLRCLSDLVKSGGANAMLASFLRWAVKNRLNVLVAGGTGSGKTTLLNMLAQEIEPGQRVITIEDAAELQFDHPHCVSLESRLAGHEGAGGVSIRDLLRNALRMRPDRIMIGECRGGEALDLLQALNTGHGGSMSTIHANSPRDALGRLEVLTLLAGLDLPIDAIRAQIASAFHLVIQTKRFSDGSRRISSVSELSGLEAGRYRMQELFCLNQALTGDLPSYKTCLSTPTCLEDVFGPLHTSWIDLFQSESYSSESAPQMDLAPSHGGLTWGSEASTEVENIANAEVENKASAELVDKAAIERANKVVTELASSKMAA
jgi:pilus assembly protein CpaF